MQGERDAKEKHSDVYAASLRGLVAQLRHDLAQKDVHFVTGRLSDYAINNTHWMAVRAAQFNVAETEPFGAWVDTDDLNDGKNKKGKEITNGLHYSVEGYKTLGKRFAEKSIELLIKNEQYRGPRHH